MKKIYYLLALIAVVFTSCDPLSQTYKSLDALPQKPGSLTVALTNTYKSSADANANIPAVLSSRYPSATNSTSASVTFSLAPSSSNIATPDSTYSRIAITLAASDYSFPASVLPNQVPVPGNSTAFFTSDGVINYLNYKYPTPAANQFIVLTYLYSETNVTPAAGAIVTDSFVYMASGWTKIYTVSPAQYALAGRGTNNYFLSTSAEFSLLAGYFNTFLKNDPIVSASAKVGSVQFVSYRSTATFQKILTLTFDGTNWLPKQTLPYLKLNGTWVPDPTIYIVEPANLVAATYNSNLDFVYIGTLTNIGTAAGRLSAAQYADFDIRGSSAAFWNNDDINAALAALLLHKFPNASIGVPYNISYYYFLSGSPTKTSQIFVFDGTSFVLQ